MSSGGPRSGYDVNPNGSLPATTYPALERIPPGLPSIDAMATGSTLSDGPASFGDAGVFAMDAADRLSLDSRAYRLASPWDRAAILSRRALFEIVYELRRGLSLSRLAVTALLLVETLQLLSSAFPRADGAPSWGASVDWLSRAAAAANFGSTALRAAGSWDAVVAILAIALLLAAAAVAVALSLAFRSRQLTFLVAPLRAALTYGGFVLLLPTATVMGAVLRCGSVVPAECGSAASTVLTAVALVAGGGLFAVYLLVALLVFDPSPRSADLTARPHGRAAAVAVAAKGAIGVVLGVAWSVPPDSPGAASGRETLMALAALAAGLGLLAPTLWLLPFYRVRMTRLAAMQGAVLTWAGASALLKTVADLRGETAAAVFLVGGAMGTALTAAFLPHRVAYLRAQSVQHVASPFLAEACARAEVLSLRLNASAAAHQRTYRLVGAADGLGSPELGDAAADTPEDTADAELGIMMATLRAAAPRTNAEAWVRIFMYISLRYLGDDRSAAVAEARRARKLDPWLDAQAMIYVAEREDAEQGGGRKQSASFLEYEMHLQAAKEAARRALTAQLDLWVEYDLKVPDLDHAFGLAVRLVRETRRAQSHFEAALRINPKSITALRKYAGFLIAVQNEPAAAQELLAKADALEDEEATLATPSGQGVIELMRAGEHLAELDALDERNTTIVIEGDGPHVGNMVSVSAAVLRLTGHRPALLVNKNLSALLPPPFAALHDTFVLRYTQTRRKRYMDSTRPVFVVTRAGYIRPALLTLSDMTGSAAAGVTRYVGVLGAIKCNSEHVLVIPDGTVVGCTEGAAAILNITLAQVHERALHIARLLPAVWDAAAGAVVEGAVTVEGPGGSASELRLVSSKLAGDGYSVTLLELSEARRLPGLRAVPERSSGSNASYDDVDATPAMASPLPAAVTAGAPPGRTLTLSVTTQRGAPDDSPRAGSRSRRSGRDVQGDASRVDAGGVLDDWGDESESGSQSHSGSVGGPSAQDRALLSAARKSSGDSAGDQASPRVRSRLTGPASVARTPVAKDDDGAAATAGPGTPLREKPAAARRASGLAIMHCVEGAIVDEQANKARPAAGSGTAKAGEDRQEEKMERVAYRAPSQTPPAMSSDDVDAPHVLLRRAEDGGGAVDDTGSHQGSKHASSHGSSSRASSMGVRTMHNAIKHMNTLLDPELVRLRRLIVGLLALFSLLLVGVVAVSDIFLKKWERDVVLVRLSERRLRFGATFGLDVESFQLYADGELDAPRLARARNRILSMVTRLDESRFMLMEAASHDSRFTMLPIKELKGGNLSLSPANEWTAVMDLSLQALMVREFPLEVFNASAILSGERLAMREKLMSIQAYVRNNLATIIVPALRAASARYDRNAVQSVEFVEALLFVVTAAAMVPMLLSVVFAYAPAMIRNEHRRHSALLVFLRIPKAVCFERATACRAALAEFLTDAVDDDDEDRPGAVGQEHDDDLAREPPKAAVEQGAKQPERRVGGGVDRKRPYRLSKSGLRKSILRFSVGYVLAVGTFAFVLFYAEAAVQDAREITANTFFAARRAAALRIAHWCTRNYAMQHDLASHEAAVALSNAQAYLDEMVDLDNALVYGSPARGTRGLFHQTVTDYQRVLNLMDGCQTRWASAGRGQACSTFYNGALKTGTHAALVAGAQLIRDLWAQRVREGRRATLLSHDMLMLEEFDDLYLVNMLGTSEIVYEENAGDHMRRVLSTLWMVAVGFAFVNLCIYITFYRHLIAGLNRDLVHARSLLLIIPSDVVRTNQTVRKYVAALNSEMSM